MLSPWKFAEILGKAMLTMKRSSEERNTPVSTIRAVRTGRPPSGGALDRSTLGSVMKLTLREKVA